MEPRKVTKDECPHVFGVNIDKHFAHKPLLAAKCYLCLEERDFTLGDWVEYLEQSGIDVNRFINCKKGE